jgi:hypothetical protein
MTVQTTIRLVDNPGDGSSTVFPYPFKIFVASHLVVTIIDAVGVGIVQSLGVDYTVSGVNMTNGGNVTMTVAPAGTETLRIERTVPATQLTDLRNQGTYLPQNVENAMDWIVMAIQAQLAVLVASAGSVRPGFYTDSPETRPVAVASNKGLLYYVQNAGGNTRLESIYEKATGGTYGRKIHWQTID